MLGWLLGLPLFVYGILEDDDVVVLKKNTFDAFIRKVFSILIGQISLHSDWRKVNLKSTNRKTQKVQKRTLLQCLSFMHHGVGE